MNPPRMFNLPNDFGFLEGTLTGTQMAPLVTGDLDSDCPLTCHQWPDNDLCAAEVQSGDRQVRRIVSGPGSLLPSLPWMLLSVQ